jgi:hypothetical protein
MWGSLADLPAVLMRALINERGMGVVAFCCLCCSQRSRNNTIKQNDPTLAWSACDMRRPASLLSHRCCTAQTCNLQQLVVWCGGNRCSLSYVHVTVGLELGLGLLRRFFRSVSWRPLPFFCANFGPPVGCNQQREREYTRAILNERLPVGVSSGRGPPVFHRLVSSSSIGVYLAVLSRATQPLFP